MKRRVISFITVLAMCLSLCPTGALAADRAPDAGLCPHHQVHTEECGYVPPAPGRDCAHEHDESCFIAETRCVHQHTEDCYPEPSSCTHECSGDSGCVMPALDCPHVHDEFCGYVPEETGAPCMFVCRVCLIEDLIGRLPRSVTPDNESLVEDQLNAILALYTGLTGDEQEQLDLSRCFDLQAQLDAANTPMLLADSSDLDKDSLTYREYKLSADRKNQKLLTVKVGWTYLFDTCGYSCTEEQNSVFQVPGTSALWLTGGGTITSKKGSGVEVEAGGKLYIEDAGLTVSGSAYGLKIASGATVQLSGGTYTGNTAAIQAADGNFGSLLKSGYAYFDDNGDPISDADMETAKKVVVKAQPVIVWTTGTQTVNYNGSPVSISQLPQANVTAPEDLSGSLKYSYRKADSTGAGFTDGLPTDAGTYEIKASLSKQQNYGAAETNPCLRLTINKIPAITSAPAARQQLVYNRGSQELITAGTVHSGARIEYAKSESGPYSPAVPSETNAGTYSVYYQVIGNDNNYTDTGRHGPISVTIAPKSIIPTIEVFQSSYVYDGSKKNPKITVRDGQTVIEDDQYTIEWADEEGNTDDVLRTAGKYTATIANAANGNYAFSEKVTVEIVEDGQNALSITGMPDHVYYGDTITTLDTAGGSEDGTVTWSIESGDNYATINGASGALTIKGIGTVTVKAERAVPNYKTVTDTWTFTVEKKPITAVVSSVDRDYKAGDESATVKAEVDSSDLAFDDEITISGVTGTFDNANVGSNKTITIDSSSAIVSGTNSDKYAITYPKATTASIKPIPATISTIQGADGLTYNAGKEQPLLTDAVTATGGTVVYSLDGVAFSQNIPTGKNAGEYKVYCKALGDSNHTDSEVKSVDVTIQKRSVIPEIKLMPPSAQYDGSVKQPAVTVRDDTGHVIPESEYIVAYGTGNWKDKGTYTVTVTNASDGNYTITPNNVTFKITPSESNPLEIVNKPGLVYYGGSPFTLSAVGGSGNGDIKWESNAPGVAAVDNNGLVTINGAGEVTITAKKEATTNYSESTAQYKFTVQKKPITAIVTAEDKVYDGNTDAKIHVTWKDNDLVGTDTINTTGLRGTFADKNVGTNKTVTVSGTITSPNYAITIPTATASITIGAAELAPPPDKIDRVYDGTEQPLVSGGTTKNGIGVIEYSLSKEGGYSTDIPKGKNAGTYTVWYKVEGTGNYTGIAAQPVEVTIARADPSFDPPTGRENLAYTGGDMDLITAGSSSDGTFKYSLDQTGEYSERIPQRTAVDTYTVYYKFFGDANHTDSEGGSISVTIAKATPTTSLRYEITVTPEKKLSDIDLSSLVVDGVTGNFTWRDGGDTIAESKTYEVTFTPNETTNYETVTIEVIVTVADPATENGTGGSGSTDIPVSAPAAAASNTVSAPSAAKAPMQTSVRNNTATTVLSAAAGDNLVNEAAATQSRNVVIRPEITGNVTRTEVSLPASTVSRLGSETNAALTVSTPVADVTIPNAALDTLSSAGGAVSVVTEQAENTVALTLTAGGEEVRNVPGGLTLTVPVEDAGPGTVAVLVHDDGTRETIRKSVADNGEMRIPLNGSATVEIVDNSKEFADVPAETWAADAVAFASAHELFNGTSETTFSPEQPMSRAMLATVLYNLEGRPAQDLTNEFSDVSSDAWYAESVAWAAAKGITNGYGDGQFGPGDNVTREQFAVMLWKYAGSPAANEQALNFTDADQVSSYAAEALRWATANGILNGYDNGRLDPGGLATRAQAAQMLKNFMENV